MNKSYAISDIAPRLFHTWFAEPSWNTWRPVIKAAFGEALNPAELEVFREVAGGRDPPPGPVKQFWACVGRGGGKDSVASAIVTAAALVDYRKKLRRGERATCLLLAQDRDAAAICRGYVVAHFRATPELAAMIVAETRDGLALDNGCDIVIGANTFRGVRGKTLACVVMDEVSFWRDERSANPDVEVFRAVKPGLMRLPGSVLVCISTPYAKRGLMWSAFREHYGRSDPRVLFVKGTSLQFNPTLDAAEIASEYAADPEAARAEYGAEFRDDLSSYIDAALIEGLVDVGVTVRPWVTGVSYFAFVDAASGTGQDSFTCAIGHVDAEGRVFGCPT
jgi:hypothetical protein